MAKDNVIKLRGKVLECLPGTLFKVLLEGKHEILGHLCGKMRINSIHLLTGDEVEVEMSRYDLTKGRIVKRLNRMDKQT